MIYKLTNNKERKEMKVLYDKLFNLWNSNSNDKIKIKTLIKEFEKFGIIRIKVKFSKRATVCGNFVIEVINEICKTNIPITRSFEFYDDYIKLLTKNQKFELEKIEKKLNLDEKRKKEIYGIHILKEIFDFYQFKEIDEITPNSIIVYYGDNFGKDLPEHLGFLLDNELAVSKFGIIDEIFLHPIDKVPYGWGKKYKIYEFKSKEFKKEISKYFKV